MGGRKRFTDGAGYTRHCWECVHAKDWECIFDKFVATCEVHDIAVGKDESPDHSYDALWCKSYDDGRSDFDGIKGDSRG